MNSPKNGYIYRIFGSKKGAKEYFFSMLKANFGLYKKYQNIDFVNVKRLVYVCQGNICRSPLGEVYARSKGYDSISFGINADGESSADNRAILYAKRIGVDLSSHKTQNAKFYKPKDGDLVLFMEPSHLNAIDVSCDNIQVSLLGLWLKRSNAYLHDPFNTCDEYFERCENLVVEASDQLFKNISAC